MTVGEMMFGLAHRFPYLVCEECGTVRIEEQVEDLGPFYPADYYSIEADPERVLGAVPARWVVSAVGRSMLFGRGALAGTVDSSVRRRQVHTLVSILGSVRLAGLPRGEQSSVLDVGCGSGMLVYALGLAGLTDVQGIDPFLPEERRLDTGGRLLRRSLAETEGQFDLVMFHHSLEHVPDVEATLAETVDRLTERGAVLVRMPTVSSWAFEHYGPDWVQLDAPRHTTVLSRAGVEAVCDHVGLQIRKVRDDSTAFQFWGSEQVRAGIPLMGPTSQMTDPGRSPFSSSQVADWEARARQLNAEHQGDQAVWVLERA